MDEKNSSESWRETKVINTLYNHTKVSEKVSAVEVMAAWRACVYGLIRKATVDFS